MDDWASTFIFKVSFFLIVRFISVFVLYQNVYIQLLLSFKTYNKINSPHWKL